MILWSVLPCHHHILLRNLKEPQNIFTDSPMHENSTFEIVTKFLHEIQQFRSTNGIPTDPKVDLVLEVKTDETGQPACGYYLADHSERTIFWYHAFEMEHLPRCYEVYGPRSPSHIRDYSPIRNLDQS
jgi:hypothetical protein